jgi:hypothetical protein
VTDATGREVWRGTYRNRAAELVFESRREEDE